jgi:hypothetical protein
MKKISILFILSILIIKISLAQLVNIEEKRKEKKDGIQGNITIALKITQNTKQIIQANNDISLQYSKKSHTILFFNDLTLMVVREDNHKDDNLINENFQHFRYNYTLQDSGFFTTEFFLQRQQNKVKYLDLRFLIGSGPRFKIINNNHTILYLAPLLMYENEILNDSLGTITTMIRGDLYTSLSLNFNNFITFSNVTYYQPAIYNLAKNTDFERFKDFRIASNTSLSFSIIKNKLEYIINYEMSYDSSPPEELITKPLFYTFTNKLKFIF